MNDMIDKIYKPANGRSDDWKCGLVVDGDRLEKFLGDSPVLASIQTAGEHLLHARRIIQVLEDNEDETIDDSLADELCEAFSCFARLPTIRFYKALLVMKKVVLVAAQKRMPKKFSELPWTNAQFHALVTYCLFMQVMMHTKGPSEELMGEMVKCMDACIKARPDDASVYVLFGNWLMVNGFMQDASEKLEHAVKLDEDTCFGSYYTIANICQNAVPDFGKLSQSSADVLTMFKAQAFTDRSVHNLRRYLDLAPVGHWHVHRACMSLVLLNGSSKAKGKESIASIEKRHPGFSAESQSIFRRGVEALRLYKNCFGKEQSDFHNQYKQASGMIAQMHKDGLLGHGDDDEMQQPPQSDYICSFPTCTNAESVGKNNRLRVCSRCGTPYCCRECQVAHWKVHKKACKKLAAEQKERQAANPVKLKRPDVKAPQIGDDEE